MLSTVQPMSDPQRKRWNTSNTSSATKLQEEMRNFHPAEPSSSNFPRMTSLDGLGFSLPSISPEIACMIQQDPSIMQNARQYLPPTIVRTPRPQESGRLADDARNKEREQLHMLVKEVQQQVERRKQSAPPAGQPSTSSGQPGSSSKAPVKRWSEGRRPLGFWDPFNAWWRAEYKKLGRRPTSKEINEWHEKFARTTWSSNCPTAKETRKHAKCLRTVEGVRKYFREYRARKTRKEDTPPTDDLPVPPPPPPQQPLSGPSNQPPRVPLERGISEDLLKNPLYRFTSFPYAPESAEQTQGAQPWSRMDSLPPY